MDCLLVGIPVAVRQTIEPVGLSELRDGLEFEEVLGHVAFERVGEIGWCAEYSIRWFLSAKDIAPVPAVSFFNADSNQRDHCRARPVVGKYAPVDVSSHDQEKATSLAFCRRAFKIYKPRKETSGTYVGEEMTVVFPSNVSSELTAIVDVQSGFRGEVPVTSADVFILKLRQSGLAEHPWWRRRLNRTRLSIMPQT